MEQILEQLGTDVHLDVNITNAAYTNEARKIVKTGVTDAKIYYGRGETIQEALNNLLVELKRDSHVA